MHPLTDREREMQPDLAATLTDPLYAALGAIAPLRNGGVLSVETEKALEADLHRALREYVRWTEARAAIARATEQS